VAVVARRNRQQAMSVRMAGLPVEVAGLCAWGVEEV